MRYFILIIILALGLSSTSCQEEIATIPTPPSIIDEEEDNGGNDEGIDPQYATCLSPLSASTFDVMTWNMQFYPKEGNSTEDAVYDIVKNSQIDLIGVQEIDSETALRDLAASLGNWDVAMGNVSSRQDIGFLYNKDEVTLIEGPSTIYNDNSYAFPREPVIVKVQHSNGIEAVIINIHLKCCGGNENEDRREEASELLKSYIDANYPNDEVIVLGDWNDDIYESNGTNVFSNFMNDPANYQFADRSIAEGPSSEWSYPSFPSHIDHLMITNELFDRLIEAKTLTVNRCFNTYYSTISDHRPVMMRLE